MYEDMLAQRETYRERIAAIDNSSGSKQAFAHRNALQEAVNDINRVVGDPVEDYDPMIAEWERAVAEGRTPDFGARKRGIHGRR